MNAVVLVPYRPDSGVRTRNWRRARQFWDGYGIRIHAVDKIGKTFERAAARNLAAAIAGDWEVAVFADADILPGEHRQIDEAIFHCYRTGNYTVAYSELHYLSEPGTKDFMRQPDVGPIHPLHCEDHVGLTWECCFAVRRDLFDQVGGFDERFRGYGGQVAAFFYAYATYGGRHRVEGDAYHLAHPYIDRDKEPNFAANALLAERYRLAVDNPTLMDAILAER